VSDENLGRALFVFWKLLGDLKVGVVQEMDRNGRLDITGHDVCFQ